MRRTTLFVRAALCAAAITAAGCSSDPDDGGGGCPDDCIGAAAPSPTCDGDTRVSYAPLALCVDGTCEFAETRTNCGEDGGTCVDGACEDPEPLPCDTITCDAPPETTCDGNTIVSYGDGVCDDAIDGCTLASGAEGCCSYPEQREDCAEGDVCSRGRCITPEDPCEGVACDTPPASFCDGTEYVTYEAAGTCDPDSLECGYAEASRVDCAASDQFCSNFAGCLDRDPCDDVTCDMPPAPFCEGEVVVSYVARGTCEAGDCEYTEAARQDCAAGGQLCDMGACVDPGPCVGVVCDRGPTNRCDGTVAYSYPDIGVCNPDTSLCEYDEVVVDCADSAQICDGGFCVDPGPCDGIVCDRPPGPYCDSGMVVVSQSPGTCVEATGECEYGAVMEDCAADGLECFEGECVADAACVDVTCGEPPPANACDEDERVATRYIGLSYCEAGTCIWRTETEDCGAAGEACVAGECEAIDLCATVTCERDDFCDGNTAVTYRGPGTCTAGLCSYTAVEERVNCTTTGLTCADGMCERPVDLIAEGDIVVSEYMPVPLSGSPEDVWFELTNLTDVPLNIGGATVTNNDGTQTLTLPPLSIAAGDSVVLAASETALPAGEIDWTWGGSAAFSLPPAGGAILVAGADTISEVFYNPTEVGYTSGVSASLDTYGYQDTVDVGNWCASAREYSAGVFASPGQYGEACAPTMNPGDVVISEFMVRGTTRPGVTTEQWIELYVPGDEPMDLRGLTVENGFGDWATITTDVPLDERSYGAVAYEGAAGGADFDARYRIVVFDITSDTIIISSAGVVIDQLTYDGGWPIVDGSSAAVRSSLSPDAANNDSDASYCNETTTWPSSADNGTPGEANVCD